MPTIHTDNITEYIIDELCTCGHLKSAHSSRIYESIRATGHAYCQICDCPKFTFLSWVLVVDSEARDKYVPTPVG